MKELSLRSWKAGGYNEGFSHCSFAIEPSGLIRFVSVNAEWWIYCPDLNGGYGQSFSSYPDEAVFIKE